MSLGPDKTVVDTVVLHYFLLVERCDLLAALVGPPLLVPRIVFDPDEGAIPTDSRSELTRGIAVLSLKAGDMHQPDESRRTSELKSRRLEDAFAALNAGLITVVDLTVDERALAGRLNSRDHLADYGLLVPLGLGEAACIAIACERGHALATDDGDALKVFRRLRPAGVYARIRGLLQRAASLAIVTEEEANLLHAEMTALGFWDQVTPFPDLP